MSSHVRPGLALAWQCTATSNPASARASAIARPIRRAPPVTSAARGMVWEMADIGAGTVVLHWRLIKGDIGIDI